MRPIDADALIEKCGGWYVEEGTESGFIGTLKNLLATEPTIQPEPQEGHWINGKCNLCGEHAPFWCMASTYHESNYCPNCGAKMTNK